MPRTDAVAENEKQSVIEAYISGESTQSAAKTAGISTGSAFKVLKAAGVLRSRSESHIGHQPPQAVVDRISSLYRGKHLPDEVRMKMSESHKMHHPGHKKLRHDGYTYIYYPDHPDSTKDGYVMEHRMVMERHIGRRLTEDEVVHHINHIKTDNRIENLLLMSKSDHMSLHMRERHAERRKIKSIT